MTKMPRKKLPYILLANILLLTNLIANVVGNVALLFIDLAFSSSPGVELPHLVGASYIGPIALLLAILLTLW